MSETKGYIDLNSETMISKKSSYQPSIKKPPDNENFM